MTPSAPNQSTRDQWLALTAALLGWMFDGLEMGLFPLVARPALGDLLRARVPSDALEAHVGLWFAIITSGFLVGAATGGVLFGWLGDRIGRVRAMMLSVLTYAIFTGLCGVAANAEQIAALRFLSALGMGGEWSLGVALVMEIWPNRSRAWLAGVIGAAANFGYMLIALISLGLNAIIGDLHSFLLAVGISEGSADSLVANSAWRLLLLFGAAPALLTLLIQFFVPESHRWKQERDRGATSHWETRDLVGVLVGAAAAIGMIALWAMPLEPAVRIIGSLVAFAVITLGYLYPVYRYLGRVARSEEGARTGSSLRRVTVGRMLLAAALSGVALLGTWGSTQWAPVWADKLTGGHDPNVKAYTLAAASLGAIIGCVLAALSGNLLGRRPTYALLCVGSLAAVLGFYRLNTTYDTMFLVWAFVLGGMTAAFYGWLPLYLPELFHTKVRATGQGFGFNFGRVLAAIGVLQLPVIMRELNAGYEKACPAMALVYLVGMVLIWFAPETKGKPLPD
jgi:SHS family sialic acid transporter-like MFS transporter